MAHRNDVFRIGHLIVNLAQCRSHLVAQRACDNHHIRLSRRGPSDDAEPIEVVALVPDDPPVMFRWRRVRRRVVRAEGPERIAPEWWRKPDADDESGLRDYYRVEDENGRRYWLYREGLYRSDVPPAWFLHGLFA